MALQKLTDLSSLSATPAANDLIHIVDVSDTSQDAAGSSKKITRENLVGGLAPQADLDLHIADVSNPHLVGLSELSDYNADNNKITNVTDPTTDQDAATKKYVDDNLRIQFRAQHNIQPASNYATFNTRNGHLVLDFDATTDEEAIFTGLLPSGYGGGGLTIDIYASAKTATTGNVVWQAAIERIGDSQLDIDSDSFASFQSSGAVAVPGTSGHVKKFTVTLTNDAQIDSLAAGELFRLKIRRDADNTSATDDVTGDMELHMVTVRET